MPPRPATFVVGQRFGALSIASSVPSRKGGKYYWAYRCDCGAEVERTPSSILQSQKKSGHSACNRLCPYAVAARNSGEAPSLRNRRFVDVTGLQFGPLCVVRHLGQAANNNSALWLCRCVCGRERPVSRHYLAKLKTSRCSCALSVRDGRSDVPEYASWRAAIERCSNPNNRCYKNYGGRGIRFHEPWRDFSVFFRDVGPRPSDQHSIDRIDPNGHYEPGNVRWATRIEQCANKRLAAPRVEQILLEAEDLFGNAPLVRFLRSRLFGDTDVPDPDPDGHESNINVSPEPTN